MLSSLFTIAYTLLSPPLARRPPLRPLSPRPSSVRRHPQIGKFTASPDFTPDKVNTVSAAASGMCRWVHAMETYGYVAKDVAPKRAKLKAAQDNLAKKQAALSLAQEQLAVVLAKVQALKNRSADRTGAG
jgi:hypothetical protein